MNDDIETAQFCDQNRYRLSFRDRCAIAAMQSLLHKPNYHVESVVESAWYIADTMEKERQKRNALDGDSK